jgi:hypothetical protein
MPDTVVLLHRQEAADRLRVSVCTVKRWGAAGLLDERRVGPKLVKVTEASVERLIHAGRKAAHGNCGPKAPGLAEGQKRLLLDADHASGNMATTTEC